VAGHTVFFTGKLYSINVSFQVLKANIFGAKHHVLLLTADVHIDDPNIKELFQSKQYSPRNHKYLCAPNV